MPIWRLAPLALMAVLALSAQRAVAAQALCGWEGVPQEGEVA